MRWSRPIRLASVAAVACAMLFSLATPAAAYHRQRYQELQDRIARTQEKIAEAEQHEDALLRRLRENDETRALLERRVAGYGGQLEAASAKLAELNARLDRVTSQYNSMTVDLEEALAMLVEHEDLLTNRARAIYQVGTVNYGELLLNAPDLNSVVVGFQYAQSVLDSDSRLVEDIRVTKSRIQIARAKVAGVRREIEAAVEEQETLTRHIASLRGRQAEARNHVVGVMNERRQILGDVQDQLEAYERALQSYQRESAIISDFLRGVQSGQGSVAGSSGYLDWPVVGRITSPYGWRTHPIHGRRSFHGGIDIASPHGTTVRNARTGTVVFTGYKGAYGLVVIVDHGNSLATLYAHLSKVYVRPGDSVAGGGGLAAIGCTGWCTGPHLHFETRVGGEATNPMGWL